MYNLAGLHDWFHNHTLDIAAGFDERNFATRCSDGIDFVRELTLSDSSLIALARETPRL
jgi:hypothetical protein